MKTRKIFAGLAAATIGTLGALALVTPAQAAVVRAPVVKSVDDGCTKSNTTVKFTLAAGSQTVSVQVIDGTATQLAGGTISAATADGSLDLPVASSTTWTIRWKTGSADWAQIGAAHTWQVPDKCKPVVKTYAADCTNLNAGVAIAFPAANPAGSKMNYGFNGNTNGTLNPGEFVAYDEVVGQDINYTWSVPALGISGSDTVKYVLPKDCAAGTAGSTVNPPAKPGKKFHGRGEHKHVAYVPVVNAGNNAGGDNEGGTQESSTKAAAGGQSDAPLPVTGANVALIATVGFALAFAGGIVMWRARRRRVRFTSAG